MINFEFIYLKTPSKCNRFLFLHRQEKFMFLFLKMFIQKYSVCIKTKRVWYVNVHLIFRFNLDNSVNKMNFKNCNNSSCKMKKRKVRQNDDSEVPLLIKTVFPPMKEDSSDI